MAVWQFKVILVPKRWLDAGGAIAALVSEDGWDTASAWRGIDGVALQGRIEGILPRGRSWYPEVFIWGSEQGSDIQLSLENARVESLGIRFDLRNPDMQLFRAVFRLAEECGLVILDLARKCALPDLNGLIRAAAESDAAHFVLDPASFLAQVLTNARATQQALASGERLIADESIQQHSRLVPITLHGALGECGLAEARLRCAEGNIDDGLAAATRVANGMEARGETSQLNYVTATSTLELMLGDAGRHREALDWIAA